MTVPEPEHEESRIEEALDSFQAAWLDGRAPDIDAFCEAHADCGSQLRERIKDFVHVARALPGALQPGMPGTTREMSPEPVLPLEAEQTFGDFRIIKPLGHGGMGSVFLAEQLSSGRRVALKVLAPQVRPSQSSLERFRREGRLAASISHPRCIFVFAADEVEGTPFIAMEAMPGRTLADVLEEQEPLSITHAVDLVSQIIEGLEQAASQGVIHRDVKPSNCFMDSDGTVKIGDFGISRTLEVPSDLTVSGTFVGTPRYASPEQVRGKQLDVRSDMFSLGATFYHLLAGRPPFSGDHQGDVLAAIVADGPPPLRRRRKDVPKGLARIIDRMLNKEPGKRFPEYASLRRALAPFRTAVLKPASPGRRLVAFVLDFCIILLALIVASILVMHILQLDMKPSGDNPKQIGGDFSFDFSDLVYSLLFFGYFFVSEAAFKASPGKWICGLEVRSSHGFRIHPWAAALRFFFFWSCLLFPALMAVIFGLGGHESTWIISLLLLLYPMARRNNFRGLHELLSRTAVFHRESKIDPLHSDVALRDKRSDEPGKRDTALQTALGPFDLSSEYFVAPQGRVHLAVDRMLDRRVWVLIRKQGAPPPSKERGELARPERLRWLQGGDTDALRWDAFEAPPGRPISEVVGSRPLPWRDLRWFVLSLARELRAAVADRTLHRDVDLDQIWLGPDRSVRITDLSLNRASDDAVLDEPGAIELLRKFLSISLASPSSGQVHRSSKPRVYEAAPLLALVDKNTGNRDLENVIKLTEKLLQGPGFISRKIRLAVMAPAILASLLCLLFGYVVSITMTRSSTLGRAEWILENRSRIRFDPETVKAARDWVAIHGSRSTTSGIELREAHPAHTPENGQNASKRLNVWFMKGVFRAVSIFWYSMTFNFLVFGILLAFLFRGGAMFSILGVRVMNESGDRSSRLRCAVRAALVWIPAAALSFTGYCLRLLSMVPEGMDNAHVKESGGSSPFVQMLFGTPLNTLQAFDWVPAALVVSSMLLMGFGVLVAIRTPAKALPDWIARTYLARW